MPQHVSTVKTVSIDELTDNMVIQEYTGFNPKFQKMDDQTCDWLKHNFRGASAQVIRDNTQLDLAINQLLPTDSLLRIHRFPAELKKITLVTSKLTAELKRRGFTEFKVFPPAIPTTTAQAKRQQAVRQTEAFVHQVKESVALRDNTTDAIEHIMDNSRRGKIDTQEIAQYVDTIVGSSSSDAISAISSLKQSDQTYAHCVDVGAIFKVCYEKVLGKTGGTNVFKDEQEILLSSFLHDFGKAKVPKEIIDSTARFDMNSREMQLIRKHPDYGAELLSAMNMPAHIIKMAHYHHIKLDTSMASSYPTGVKYDEIPMEARLIAIIDVYQALVGKRSYKKSWAPPAAMRFIDQLSGIEYDMDVWDAFQQVMGRYPKGSLVELNDSSCAFVVSVPAENLNRPQVVVVRNANGEDLSHHSLLDLDVEQDMSIVKELDNYETFGDNVIDVFTSLHVI